MLIKRDKYSSSVMAVSETARKVLLGIFVPLAIVGIFILSWMLFREMKATDNTPVELQKELIVDHCKGGLNTLGSKNILKGQLDALELSIKVLKN